MVAAALLQGFLIDVSPPTTEKVFAMLFRAGGALDALALLGVALGLGVGAAAAVDGFDIGQLEQLSTKDKQDMLFELVGFIMVEKFETINDFTTAALREFPEQYREIIVGYNSILERYCRGNYLNAERKRKARETGACGKVDGSMEQCVTTGAE